jgi:hypothetical protein
MHLFAKQQAIDRSPNTAVETVFTIWFVPEIYSKLIGCRRVVIFYITSESGG